MSGGILTLLEDGYNVYLCVMCLVEKVISS
jgi:hypothetical protein